MKQASDLAAVLVRKARHDLGAMSLTLSGGFPDVSCFHAQQAAEKALKAFLTMAGVMFPYTHSIEDLVSLAAKHDPKFRDFLVEGESLSPFAVDIRYDEEPSPGAGDARIAARTARAICRFVFQRLPKAVRSPKTKKR